MSAYLAQRAKIRHFSSPSWDYLEPFHAHNATIFVKYDEGKQCKADELSGMGYISHKKLEKICIKRKLDYLCTLNSYIKDELCPFDPCFDAVRGLCELLITSIIGSRFITL